MILGLRSVYFLVENKWKNCDAIDMGTLIEFIEFAMQNKKWWLIPFVLLIGAISLVLYVGSGTVAAPFVYTLF